MYKRLKYNKYSKCVNYEKKLDERSNCEYILTRVKKDISLNEKIIPRVRTTNKVDFGSSTSLYDYMVNEDVLFAINAGIFNTKTSQPECLLISNRKVIIDRKETYIHTSPRDGGEKREELYILGIDLNGDLKVFEPNSKAEDIISNGILDAVMGFVPLIIDYKEQNHVDAIYSYGSYDKHPRQIIGQFDNNDYFVLTVLEPGMTLDEVRSLLSSLNVKIAYNLDGGSSTQTIFYKKRLTPIYRENTGRRVPTIITFEVITGDLQI